MNLSQTLALYFGNENSGCVPEVAESHGTRCGRPSGNKTSPDTGEEDLHDFVQRLNEDRPLLDKWYTFANKSKDAMKLRAVIDDWKSGEQESVRKGMLDYINKGGKGEPLTPDAYLVLKSIEYSPPIAYPLYRGMIFKDESSYSKFVNYFKQGSIQFAAMGYSGSEEKADEYLPTEREYNRLYGVKLIIQSGSKALNITRTGGFLREKEHITAGEFEVVDVIKERHKATIHLRQTGVFSAKR